MPAKTAQDLITYAKSLLGAKYMWGTYGSPLTNDLIDRKVKQYGSAHYKPEYVTKLRTYVGKGLRGVDCCGLIKYAMMAATPGAVPVYAGQYDHAVGGMKKACTSTGKIATLPEAPGLLLFMGTSHVGIYLGGGKAIEARGSDEVRITQVKGRGWTDWGQLSWVQYPTQKPVKREDWSDMRKEYKSDKGSATPVYADSSKKQKVGEIFPGSTCQCIGEQEGLAIVLYKISGTGTLKVGFADATGVQT